MSSHLLFDPRDASLDLDILALRRFPRASMPNKPPKRPASKTRERSSAQTKKRSNAIIKSARSHAAGAICLRGYAHNDDDTPEDAAHLHIYPSLLDLSFCYRVNEADILYEESPDDDAQLGPTTFYIKKDAVVVQLKTASAVEQSQLFVGPVSARFAFRQGEDATAPTAGTSKVRMGGRCTDVRSGGGASCDVPDDPFGDQAKRLPIISRLQGFCGD